MRFRHGDAEAPLKVVGKSPPEKKGTRVTFLPSPDTFKIIEFDFEKLEHRYRELAFLNSGVRLVLADARHEERVEHELFYEGGIAAFVKYLDRAKTPLFPEPIAISAVRDGIGIDQARAQPDKALGNAALAASYAARQSDDVSGCSRRNAPRRSLALPTHVNPHDKVVDIELRDQAR